MKSPDVFESRNHPSRNRVWVKCSTAVAAFGISRSTIYRRATPWQSGPISGRIRFKSLQLDAHGELVPRYFYPDLLAYTLSPTMAAEQGQVGEDEAAGSGCAAPFIRIAAAAAYLDLIRDSIEDRLVEWSASHVPFRIRHSSGEMKVGKNYAVLCHRPDVEALLKVTAESATR